MQLLCIACKESKDLIEFKKITPMRTKQGYIIGKNRIINNVGHYSYCKVCERREKFEAMLFRIHGITIEDYQQLYEIQGGKCAICKKDQDYIKNDRLLFVDHSRKTKKVRGLLCNSCNLVLGWAKEDISVLEEAISYLKIHGNR